LSGSIFTTKAHINNPKKLVKQQYLVHMSSQIGKVRPTNGLDRLLSWHPSKFQRVLHLGFFTALTLLNESQPNFGCLAGAWYIIYTFFGGLMPPNAILPGAKFTLRPSLAFSLGSVTALHLSSGRQTNFMAWYKQWNYSTFTPRHFHQSAPSIF